MYYPSSDVMYQRYLDKCGELNVKPLERDDWQDEKIDRSDMDE